MAKSTSTKPRKLAHFPKPDGPDEPAEILTAEDSEPVTPFAETPAPAGP